MVKAGDQLDAITVCPSTNPVGAWWTSEGQSILQETLDYLRQRGVERIYLAGLSNGAIGTSRLAHQFKSDVAGLILISGADPRASIADIPVLLLHGRNDERIPVSVMEGYALAAGMNAEYHLFESDHFLLLKQADDVQKVIVGWLRRQERNAEDE
jgi:pimeloyl-ACP methyl ester carboxylesterase